MHNPAYRCRGGADPRPYHEAWLSTYLRGLCWLVLVFALGPGEARGVTVVDATSDDFSSAASLDGLEVDAESGTLLLAAGRRRGRVVSRTFTLAATFDRACVSWNADVPDGSQLTVELSVDVGLAEDGEVSWSPWQVMGVWAEAGPAVWGEAGQPPEALRLPRSRRGEGTGEDGVAVAVDTLQVLGASGASSIRYRLTLAAGSERLQPPRVHRVAIACWSVGDRATYRHHESPAWGHGVELVHRAQRWEDPEIAGAICSPTSLGMVLEFHGIKLTTQDLCRRVYDHGAGIFGNWSFNVAVAGELGLEAQVDRFRSLEQLEAQILAGCPVIISHRWGSGELRGAPVETSDGHLVVVVGFSESGDVIVHDPAIDPRRGDGLGRRVYHRRDIYRTWLENSSGIVYLIRPRP